MGVIDVHHEIAGEGDPVVLLNGIMMTTDSWVFQTRRLSEEYRVVLHDFRGQLKSAKPAGPYRMRDHVEDLAALLDRLGIGSAHLVGTSYGGEVGMMFALAYPERVRTLCVIACVSHIEPPLREAVTLWRDAARHAPGTLYDITAPYNFSPAFLTPSLMEQGRARLRRYPPEFFRAFADLCDAFLELDITDSLARIARPTLVVCGALDVLKPVAYSRLIAERIPNASLQIVPDAGHAVVIEKWDEVNELLLAHLRNSAA